MSQQATTMCISYSAACSPPQNTSLQGGQLLSAVELGATGERDFSPGGGMFFSRYWAEDSVLFASSVDFHFLKMVEISEIVLVLLSM